ncbi:unnamed protein product [marine sediment metagenome]|uniref:Uncharacterized protein n=1 Tax=marine sediment metagenome TaxID=412755 RepID=X1IFY4_9ZZZZ
MESGMELTIEQTAGGEKLIYACNNCGEKIAEGMNIPGRDSEIDWSKKAQHCSCGNTVIHEVTRFLPILNDIIKT